MCVLIDIIHIALLGIKYTSLRLITWFKVTSQNDWIKATCHWINPVCAN